MLPAACRVTLGSLHATGRSSLELQARSLPGIGLPSQLLLGRGNLVFGMIGLGISYRLIVRPRCSLAKIGKSLLSGTGTSRDRESCVDDGQPSRQSPNRVCSRYRDSMLRRPEAFRTGIRRTRRTHTLLPT